MNQESEFETVGEQPFPGELEDERSRVRSLRGQQARYAAAMRKNRVLRQQYSRLKGQQYRRWPLPPRPPINRFPIRFPIGGGSMYPPGLGMEPNQWLTPNGMGAAQPASCAPCNCPSCADQPNATQPPMDQPAMDQPGADQPDTNQAQGNGAQPDMGQEPGDKELWEFFNPQNEFELASEYQNWTRENGATHGSADPRIIDLTARADKSRRLRMRDPKKVHALVLHQMACCFKVKDPLTRFLKMAPHFAILPDGRILQFHPILALTGASNGFNAGSVAVEFAGNFPDTKGKWWHGPQNGMNQVTAAQIEAGRYLVRYLIRTMGLKTILAHRQSSGTRDNDPGPDIWFHVGQWAIDNLGLKDGGPGFKVGTGNAIPDLWRKWGQAKPQPELELETNGSSRWGRTSSLPSTSVFGLEQETSAPPMVNPAKVSCAKYNRSYPIFRAIGTTDPVGVLEAVSQRAVQMLNNTIDEMTRIRERVRAGEPLAFPLLSDQLAWSLQTRMLMHVTDRNAWLGKGTPADRRTAELIIRWLSNIRKIIAGGHLNYRCLDDTRRANGTPICGPQTWAWVFCDKYRINLCRRFWNAKTGIDAVEHLEFQAQTIIHEASHIYYCTEDSGLGPGAAECISQFVADANGSPIDEDFVGVCGARGPTL